MYKHINIHICMRVYVLYVYVQSRFTVTMGITVSWNREGTFTGELQSHPRCLTLHFCFICFYFIYSFFLFFFLPFHATSIYLQSLTHAHIFCITSFIVYSAWDSCAQTKQMSIYIHVVFTSCCSYKNKRNPL